MQKLSRLLRLMCTLGGAVPALCLLLPLPAGAKVGLRSAPGQEMAVQDHAVVQVVRQGDWQLRTEILQPGSRSEGRHGVLLHDGQPVSGTPGQELETDLGTLVYRGPKDGRTQLWEHSGWELTKPAPDLPGPVLEQGAPRPRPGTLHMNDMEPMNQPTQQELDQQILEHEHQMPSPGHGQGMPHNVLPKDTGRHGHTVHPQ